jgi:hypothetical protein
VLRDGLEHREPLARARGLVVIAYTITSETARNLILITPGSGSMEAFFRGAGEPARERVLPPAGPLDIERIRAVAERTQAVTILGPPPFRALSA